MIELFFVVTIVGIICIDHRLRSIDKNNRAILEYLRSVLYRGRY